MHDVSREIRSLESILVVYDFLDVFPNNLLNLPSEHDIHFLVEIEPGAWPISIPPYRMAPEYLKGLPFQLKDISGNGYFRPSISPWDTPILIVKKNGSTMCMFINYR